MAYKKYKPEISVKINRLQAKRWMYGEKIKSGGDFQFYSNRYNKLTQEIDELKADPDSYDYKDSDVKRQIKSVRAYLSKAKKEWKHKVPILEKRLKKLLKKRVKNRNLMIIK
jgi:uncharacterized coiled-coil DUF342 family protein